MRRIYRHPLPIRLKTYLKKRQAVVNTGAPVQQIWSTARRTKTLRSVFETLVVMAGRKVRCYFCNDSRGTDIEHFWPKNRYPERVFEWLNMLLVCSGCNRLKAEQFPFDQDGQPLLIDPTEGRPVGLPHLRARDRSSSGSLGLAKGCPRSQRCRYNG